MSKSLSAHNRVTHLKSDSKVIHVFCVRNRLLQSKRTLVSVIECLTHVKPFSRSFCSIAMATKENMTSQRGMLKSIQSRVNTLASILLFQ